MADEDIAICEKCEHNEDDCVCCGICEKADCECCDECGNFPCECCDTCGCMYCECCHVCEMAPDDCECCGDCECNPCECEGGAFGSMGTSKIPGWIKRGHQVAHVDASHDWQSVWPDIDLSFDPVMAAAEFYLLEAIVADVANGIPGRPVKPMLPNTRERDEELLIGMGIKTKAAQNKKIKERDAAIVAKRAADAEYDLAWIIGEADLLFQTVVDRADKTLVPYFHMACAGEARHHKAIGGQVLAGPDSRDRAWTGWKKIYDSVGPEAIKDLSALLGEIGGGSYGGERWATAADVLFERVTGGLGPTDHINKRLFVDRAWTLEHNGGCFLNKVGWGVKNSKGWTLEKLKTKVLEAHCSDPPQYRILANVVGSDVQDIFIRYWDAANARRVAAGLDPVDNPQTHSQVRILCRFCNANPELGHQIGCVAPAQHDFDGGDLSKPKTWFYSVEEDDWSNFNWMGWRAAKTVKSLGNPYPVSAAGKLELASNTPTKIEFGLSINSKGRGWKQYKRKKEMSLEEAMNFDFIPKTFGKNQGPLGEIFSYEWSLRVYIRLQGSWQPIVVTSDYYGKNTSANWQTAKWDKWMATPIAVGNQIIMQLPHLTIGAVSEEWDTPTAKPVKKPAKKNNDGTINVTMHGATGYGKTFTYVLANTTTTAKVTTA